MHEVVDSFFERVEDIKTIEDEEIEKVHEKSKSKK